MAGGQVLIGGASCSSRCRGRAQQGHEPVGGAGVRLKRWPPRRWLSVRPASACVLRSAPLVNWSGVVHPSAKPASAPQSFVSAVQFAPPDRACWAPIERYVGLVLTSMISRTLCALPPETHSRRLCKVEPGRGEFGPGVRVLCRECMSLRGFHPVGSWIDPGQFPYSRFRTEGSRDQTRVTLVPFGGAQGGPWSRTLHEDAVGQCSSSAPVPQCINAACSSGAENPSTRDGPRTRRADSRHARLHFREWPFTLQK